ncbi:MAG: hypothetical protein Q9P14_02410 [candidate division KSB1 bacterium]|nr:hypothetical protein [candidate division KSB1 bacterium]MDQ7065080.1 hypothetical protein [candidate division KSB1 bacterium]
MEWFASNWLLLSLLGLFMVLHLFGHRHGRQPQPVDEDSASSPTSLSRSHHGCCGGHGAHVGSHRTHAHSDPAHGGHDCCGGKKKQGDKAQIDLAGNPETQTKP